MRTKQNSFYIGFIFIISLFLLLSPFEVLATEITEVTEVTEETEEIVQEILTLEFREVEGILGLYSGVDLVMLKDSSELEHIENIIIQGVKTEFKEGLQGRLNEEIIKDHVEMKVWGVFLNKYLSKTVVDMPSDNIEIETETKTYNIRGNKLAKEWLHKDVIPYIVNNLKQDSKQFPVEKYRVSLSGNQKWVDVGKIDLSDKSNLEIVSIEYPLSEEVDNYLLYNTGTSYGLILNPKYIEVLKGYNGELEYTLPVKSEIPSSVSTLAHVVILKNLENETIEDKSFSDMGIYEDLAVDLQTRDLISISDLKREKTKLEYKDMSLKEEELILVNLTDSTVLVQSVYLECFNWGNKPYSTGTLVDFSDILLGTGNSIKSTNGTISIRTYQDNGDILNTEKGERSPFLIFASVNNLPFDRLLMWIHSDISVGEMSEVQKENMNETIKDMMYAQGKKAEYKEYMKAAGVHTSSYILIAVIVVVLVAGIIVFLVIKNKNTNPETEIDHSDLLFDTNPTTEDDNDNGDEDNLF